MPLLKDFPLNLEIQDIMKQIRLRKENNTINKIATNLLERSLSIAKPKAAYKICYIDKKDIDQITVDNIVFNSHILRVNLDKANRVFPYVATCGLELDEIEIPSSDLMQNYCFDIIKREILRRSFSYLKEQIMNRYAIRQISRMSPGSGSLEDWPIVQQKELFSLLAYLPEQIGVTLTESYMMKPVKSVSGLFFQTEIQFESCQICPRANCIGRRAAYDEKLAAKYHQH